MVEVKKQDPQVKPGDVQKSEPGAAKGEELLSGKFTTEEERDKAYRESVGKMTQATQETAEVKKQLKEFQEAQHKVVTADTAVKREAAEKRLLQKKQQLNDYLKKNAPGDPIGALSTALRDLGFMTREDMQNTVLGPMTRANETVKKMQSIRNRDPKLFDSLEAEMNEELEKLPSHLQCPEMVDQIFGRKQLQKGGLTEEQIKRKLEEEERAGISVGGSRARGTDSRTDDDKKMDAVIEAHKKSKAW